ncbi:MAG: anhydro-N-acetylmuramic acid kinase [Planctomycetia bacterium]|nr:anhydro-N-acetylmuramic acid kinase [Planctomycetia bacterium]
MLFPFRNGIARTVPSRPLFAGVMQESDGTRLKMAVLGLAGCRTGTPIELFAAETLTCPPLRTESEVSDLQKELRVANTRFDFFVADSLVRLLERSRIARDDLILSAVASRKRDRPIHTFGLAQRTGFTLLDGFEEDGVSRLGHGCPFQSFLCRLLLSCSERTSILVNLGRSVHLTLLPAEGLPADTDELQRQELFPCGDLLDALTERATGGRLGYDDGGRLSVQGRVVPDVVSLFRRSYRVWREECLRDRGGIVGYERAMTSFLLRSLDVESGPSRWHDLDILCSAVNWIAEEIVASLRRVGGSPAHLNLILSGGGVRNALLRCLIARSFSPEQVRLLPDLGFPDDSFDAVILALWAALVAWRLPEQLTPEHSPSGGFPRARITPGCSSAWSTFLAFQLTFPTARRSGTKQ